MNRLKTQLNHLIIVQNKTVTVEFQIQLDQDSCDINDGILLIMASEFSQQWRH